MIPSNNYTAYGIHSNAERYSWAAYNLFIFLSSLIGDTLILYASFQRDSFQIHKFIVTMMQYITVSDLTVSIIGPLPGAESLIANTWVLGEAMCYAQDFLSRFIYPVGTCLIAVMTTGKFLHLKYPLRSTNLNKRMAHKISILS